VAVLLLAAIVRIAVLYGASVLPFFTHHRLDALVYDRAGSEIAAGDWGLGDGVFHMSPGYAYFVGTIYTIFGSGPWPIRIAQLLLGVGTVALIWAAASYLFTRRWAIAAGVVAALYGPLAFYETNLITASLAAFLHALVLWLALRAMRRGTIAAWTAAGVAWGAAAAVRPTALLFALPLGVALWLATRESGWRRRAVLACALAGAAAAVIAPVTIRNLERGGEFVLVTNSGGLDFYIGNGPGAHGAFRIPSDMPDAGDANARFVEFRAAAERDLGRSLSSREVNGYWWGKTWDEIRARPGHWLRLLLEKAWLFWNGRELPNTHDYAFHRRINPVLFLPLLQFGWVAPFALLGVLALLARRGKEDWLVGTFIAVQFAALVAFFVLARYRIPAIPALLLAAVFGAQVLWDGLRKRTWPRLAWTGPVFLGGAVLAFWPKFQTDFDDEYSKLGFAYQVQGDLRSAEEAYLEALAINHQNLSAHENLARLYEQIGDPERARSQWQLVTEIARAQHRDAEVRAAEQELARLRVRPP